MSVNDPHIVFNSLLTRYLSGELSPDELKRFQEIISADPALKQQLDEARKIWRSMDGVAGRKGYDLDAEWEMLRPKIPGFDTPVAEQKESLRDAGKTRGRTLLWYTYRIAAALVVGLVFAFAWIYATQFAGTVLVVADNEPVEVLLQDGSQVLLNRDSRLRYPKEFSGDKREIRLTGEAWFDVARDTTNPFVIDAGSAWVEVLGTSFNVNAYRENSAVEITVESGVVALMARQELKEQIVLRAGNSGSYNTNSKELVLVPSSDPNNLSWKTRELYFDHTTLEEVARLVSKVYNTSLVIQNQELEACPITVTFRDQSLESVLSVLEMTLDLEISRTGNRIILDGAGCAE
ncbi:MAG: FecR domain-containing protein [Bacteroidota bacterium]